MTTAPATARPTRTWPRRLRRAALCLAGAYLGVFLLLLALERWLLFHPTAHDRHWEAPPPAIRAEDVWLPLDNDVVVHAWWCPTERWKPSDGALLYAHGNAGNLSHRGGAVRRWQEGLGTGVLIFDYPGDGRSTGTPGEAACYAAADVACDWLTRDKGVAPERIVLLGKSLGGGVAVELATRRPYRALVLLSAFTSVPDMAANLYPWLPVRPFVRNRFENLKKIADTPGRVFVAHGTADRMIPFAMAERLFEAAPGPKRLFPLHGHDHNQGPGPDFYENVARFLREVEAP